MGILAFPGNTKGIKRASGLLFRSDVLSEQNSPAAEFGAWQHERGTTVFSKVTRLAAGSCAILLLSSGAIRADFSSLTLVASGLSSTAPVYVTSPPEDSSKLFVVGLLGDIRIVDVDTGTVNPTPFLTLDDTRQSGEGGLLGMAFHPDYATNGKFYTYSTVANGDTTYNGSPSPFNSHVREFTVSADPAIANPVGREILSFIQPTNVHNAGWMGFNPVLTPGQPQYLHIASGDGGDRPAAQDVDSLLGKMLRIDVDGDDFAADPDRNYAIPSDNPFVGTAGADEVLAMGLRNPWRNSFDTTTGDLWIGDVGEGRREEVNLLPAGNLDGDNYAWPRVEGSLPLSGGVPEPGDIVPVYEYEHGTGEFQGNSIIGGYIYRGPDPEAHGKYLFADNRRKKIWSFDPADPGGTIVRLDDVLPTNLSTVVDPVSMGTDANGNLYIVDLAGRVFRFETDALLPGDANGDGSVDLLDLDILGTNFGLTPATFSQGDFNEDGVVDLLDLDGLGINFGEVVGSAAPSLSVPEPAAAVAASMLLFFASLRSAPRRGHS